MRPGGIVAGEDADVGHGDDLGFGASPGAAGLGPLGVPGGEQVQGVGPELIPRPQALAAVQAAASRVALAASRVSAEGEPLADSLTASGGARP